jgi:predicted RNA binding protein YcfA (HicA-like mRNA interferase family)
MPRLPVVSGAKAVQAFRRLGFLLVGQRGSHVKLRKTAADGTLTCTVPLHDELAPGTLRSILRQAGVTVDEFVAALRGRLDRT